ncbi:MAG TPA: hypothetical protein VK580_04820 [Steroidobacteraceae bacterium]|nr:hypothetical protein [Steroidobacteraceae bacterium]
MKRLERGFGCSGFGADAKSETRTMYSPVIRVQVRVEDLLRGTWLEDEPVDRSVVAQPTPNGTKIGTRELPFDFAPVLMKLRLGGGDSGG